MPNITGKDANTGAQNQVATENEGLRNVNYVWDTGSLAWVKMTQPGGSSGGGGAVTVADGADVAQGATTDADTANTAIGRLKKIVTLLSNALTVVVSGSVSVSNFPATQPVSGTVTANLGTIAGVSTEATLALVKAKTDNLDVALSTRLKPADTLTGVTTVAAVTAITNALPAGTNRLGSARIVDSADADQTTTKGTQTSRFLGTQDAKDSGRTHINLYATGVASGTTGTETAISLTKSSGTSATSSAASFVVTSGKKFRITSITFASRGNATATAQVTKFSLRINTAGAVTTASTPIVVQGQTATPATALAYDRLSVPIPDGFEITGDGTLQFGVTANAVFVTNAPTWDVLITGYEY